jgi:hypothetical protein
MENFLEDFLKICQFLIIPAIIMIGKYMKKQTEISRDICDLKVYVLAICKELKLTCTLKDVR